ncbi:MAG: NAD(+) diphosphatase [Gammaproteobacteria bacterium]|nr:NAD(+) diphosphatase [Gammaproteobacteria bacterium]MYD79991.1 NAD(+) diphosphatase [Gammaproteobacteria bacterium]
MWLTDPDSFVSLAREPEDGTPGDSHCFVFIDGQLLSIVESGVPRPVTSDEFRWVDAEIVAKIYLGTWRNVHCYAIEARGNPVAPYVLGDLNSWLGRVESSMFYLAGRAKQMVDWNKDHLFCGRCGTPTDDHPTDRAKQCSKCGLINYPRLSPSIIVLVRRGDEALLARNSRWRHGMFSTIAGFVEPGESIEQTVHREVLEEVGLMVQNLRYLGSQPWPFPNSLMLGFHADYHSGEIACNDEEIAEARWFRYDNLPNRPGSTAISGWLIDKFVDEQKRLAS